MRSLSDNDAFEEKSGLMMEVVSTELGPMAEIKQLASAFMELAAALGIPPSRLAKRESRDRVVADCLVACTSALNWNVEVITKCLLALGSDAQLSLTVRGAESVFDAPELHLYGHKASKSEYEGFIEKLRTLDEDQGNELTVNVSLSVQKTQVHQHLRRLLSHRPGFLGSSEMLDQTGVAVFFQSDPWRKLLTVKALWDLEVMGLLSHGRRLVVVLCDAKGYLGGISVEVIGTRDAGDLSWLTVSQQSWEEFLERDTRMRTLCLEESNWSPGLETVTPDYFELNEIVPGLHEISLSFGRMRAALAATYMANNLQLDKDNRRLILRFAGTRPSQMSLPFGNTGVEPLGDFTGHALANLTRWAYLHGSPDKLLIARECMAHTLLGKASTDLAFVESRAADALEASKIQFASYLRHNTKQYFELRQQAVDAVTAYAGDVEKTVSGLTSDLVSNVYRVAGVLAAAIAAVLIEPSVTIQIIGLSIVVQICYVSLIVFYSLPAQKKRYETEKASLDGRLEVMTELEEQERTRIRNIGSSADVDFRTGYRRARNIYLWMCASCLVIGLLAAITLQSARTSTQPGHVAPTPQVTRTQ